MLLSDLNRIRKSRRVPALAAGVFIDGKLHDVAATGVRALGRDVEATSIDKWHIGSCTKSMTATLAGILIEKEILSWNTQIADVFCNWRDEINPHWHAVTLEQLLCHHGGAAHQIPPQIWERACQKKGTHSEQRLELVRSTLAQPPDAVAGSQYIYSNTGYAIAGSMIEAATKQTWEDLLVDWVFRPLKMESTGFGAPGNSDLLDQPCGHVKERGKYIPVMPGPNADNPPAIAPGAAVHCSLEDVLKFAGSHAGFGDGALVKKDTLQRLHRRYGASEYAGGWLILSRDWGDGYVLQHDGSNTMWFMSLWIAPFRKTAFVAASNVGGPAGQKACWDAVTRMIATNLNS